MAPLSRRNTRALLLQFLYADICIPFLENNKNIFVDSYRDETYYQNIDESYFSLLRGLVHQNSQKLLGIIVVLASKFDIEKMPKIHIIILMIAITEMIFSSEKIDEKIIINEAIELAKVFSDASGAKFINGTLGNFIKNRQDFENVPESEYIFFK